MKVRVGAAAALALGIMVAAGGAEAKKGPIKGEDVPGVKTGSRLDVLFVIDSTGSMGGIIDDGKREIRKVVDEILAGDPKPDLRVGLLTYRDKGDSYLSKHIPLSRDFEAFYKFMDRVVADEGGDWPEHVSRAMHIAVSTFNWDMDKNTARMMFLIGDAPAHTDYDDGFDFKKEAEIARDKKITINTLAMNTDPEVTAQWTLIAKVTGGSYKMIGYGGDASAPGDVDGSDVDSKDYSADPSAPTSGLGKAIAGDVKAAAEKTGTKYAKPAPKPAPKKGPGPKKPK